MACASRAFSSSVRIDRALPQSGAFEALLDPWRQGGREIVRQRELLACRHAPEDFAEIGRAIAGKSTVLVKRLLSPGLLSINRRMSLG